MNIRDMHNDFSKKFNKVSSAQNPSLNAAKVDGYLNEAQDMYVRLALPKQAVSLTSAYVVRNLDGSSPKFVKPSDFHHYIDGSCKIKDGGVGTFRIIPLGTEAFDRSDWGLRHCVASVVGDRIVAYPIGFEVLSAEVKYLRHLPRLRHPSNSSPYQTSMDVTQTCLLGEEAHGDIVDLAALLASGDLGAERWQEKAAKIKLRSIA